MSHSKSSPAEMKIVVSKDGPYLVSGGPPVCIQEIVPNEEGMSWDWKAGPPLEAGKDYALCRCGHSKTAPFCDDSHAAIGFDGTEAASRVPYARQAEQIDGPTLVLSDAENLCAFARFCDPGGKIWGLIEQTDNPDARKLVIREAMHCPSWAAWLFHDKWGNGKGN